MKNYILAIALLMIGSGTIATLNAENAPGDGANALLVATPQASSPDTRHNISTLTQITANANINLMGNSPMFKFYLPISDRMQVHAINLHFIITSSPLLDKSSSLTVMANDMPIKTLKLDGISGDTLTWDIQLPPELFNTGVITVKLVGYLKISDNICFDLDNPGNWLKVAGTSTVDYTYSPVSKKPTFNNFPSSIIQTLPFGKDHIIFSLPKNTSVQNLGGFLSVMSGLNRYISWRGLGLSVIKQADLNQANASSKSIVMVGTLEQLKLKTLGTKLPLELDGDDHIKTEFGQQINSDMGIIMLVTSPWDSQQTLLILTGENWSAVNKAVSEINNLISGQTKSDSNYLLVNKYSQPPRITKPKTFNDLGMSTGIIYGIGQHDIPYTLFIDKYIPKNVNLNIELSTSPNASETDKSTLTLKVNEYPFGAVKLSDSNSGRSIWSISIPGYLLNVGTNTLDFIYDKHYRRINCVRLSDSFVWGTIYNQSKIDINYSDEMAKNQLSQMTNLLSGNTIFVISNDDYYYTNSDFISQLLTFVKDNSHITNLRLINGTDVTKDLLSKNNVIYFGDIKESNLLKNDVKFNQEFYKYPEIGYVSLANSPSQSSKILIVSTQKNNLYPKILKALNTPNIKAIMTGDTALFNATDSFISVNAVKENYIATTFYYVKTHWEYFSIMGAILLAFIVGLVLLRPSRKK